ncbi:hypothetical protein [Kitasatospora sp. DSM 101779]|uniref:hypothetical protein n=1 Tax=Kitasatospora sp. DSM 101779 TaxID=2853165 RepID=UPI0021DA2938|nr:hypothetical protein [Kitasatospora sp. DSM 101779]MCU7826213.1 hypothetical protein [Kitasatospora sp. DSM 101779]
MPGEIAALGACRFVAPQTFRSLPAHRDGPVTAKGTAVTVTQSLGPLGAHRTGVSHGLGPIGARYGDNRTAQHSAVGRHQHVFDPASSLHEHVDGPARSGVPVDGLRPVDPGARAARWPAGAAGAVRRPRRVRPGGRQHARHYAEATADGSLGPAELASHARDFRTLAEVPD